MRIFAGDKVRSMMEWLGMEKGVAIESKTVSQADRACPKSGRGRNFETRKHVLKYDDVMNKQRETIYGLRRQLMFEPDHREYLLGETGVAHDLLHDLTQQLLEPEIVARKVGHRNLRGRDRKHLRGRSGARCGRRFQDDERRRRSKKPSGKRRSANYEEKEKIAGDESLRAYERYIMLNIIDSQWKDHLLSIDQVKQGIGLVGYGQKDPLVEYKKQTFDMFQDMLDRIDTNTTKALFNLEIVTQDEQEERERLERLERSVPAAKPPGWHSPERWRPPKSAGAEAARHTPFVRDTPKVKPNDPCYCGSGKKFKKCHGAGDMKSLPRKGAIVPPSSVVSPIANSK